MRVLRFVYTLSLLIWAFPVMAQTSEPRWTTLTNQQGARVDYPKGLFLEEGRDSKKVSFATSDGRAQFELFSASNVRGESPAQFMSRQHEREQFSYKRVSRNFIAASTVRSGRILYRRCNFSGKMIHCVDLRYPAEEKRAWDNTITRISLSLRPR